MATQPNPKLSSSTVHQKARLLNYLEEHGQITTIQARSELDVMMPAARIFDLKADGHNILTYLGKANTGLGTHAKVVTYVLMPS